MTTNEEFEAESARIAAAKAGMELIMATLRSDDEELADAQMWVRDNLGEVFSPEEHPELAEAIRDLWASQYSRDAISTLAMDLSLCPMHFCDWQACFDDQHPDCAQIRAVFPHGHDT